MTKKLNKITDAELALFGVSMSIVARVGDKTFIKAVSPLEFSIFKKDYYPLRLHAELVREIEASLEQKK